MSISKSTRPLGAVRQSNCRSARLTFEVLEARALLTLVASTNGNTDSASLVAAGGPGASGTIGFINVGQSSTHNATVTYLGNRWCLTAAHVTIDNNVGLVRFGNNSYTVDMSSITQLVNSDNKPTDLKVFRLTTDPGLPYILPSQIVTSTPTGRQIMIGNGFSIDSLHYWHADTTQNPWVWTEQSPPLVPGPDDYKGFVIDGNSRVIRWGENDFDQSLTLEDPSQRTIGYLTQFDDLTYTLQQPRASEAQASSGDSGGAVYSMEGGQWHLAGIIDAINDPRSGQPSGTTMFGDLTFIVDLSQYRNQILAATSSVASRDLFYKGSTAWDVTNNNLPGFSDDNAIAPDKTAYLPGSGTSSFSAVSSYDKGINGVMVDLYAQHGALSANDFIFKVGNNNSPSTWSSAPAPTMVTTRAGAGVGGTDRVELMWANGAISGKWLEVTVRGNDALGASDTNTGLAASDVFFFGSAPGDSGAAESGGFSVTSSDEISARNDPHGALNPATISNVNDYNRDGQVTSSDQIIARNNGTGVFNQLNFLVVGAGGPFAPATVSGAAPQASTVEARSGSSRAAGDSDVASALASSTWSSRNPSASPITAPVSLSNREPLDSLSRSSQTFDEQLRRVLEPRDVLFAGSDALTWDDGLVDALMDRLAL